MGYHTNHTYQHLVQSPSLFHENYQYRVKNTRQSPPPIPPIPTRIIKREKNKKIDIKNIEYKENDEKDDIKESKYIENKKFDDVKNYNYNKKNERKDRKNRKNIENEKNYMDKSQKNDNKKSKKNRKNGKDKNKKIKKRKKNNKTNKKTKQKNKNIQKQQKRNSGSTPQKPPNNNVPSPPRAAEASLIGDKYCKEGKYLAAISQFQQAIKLDPNQPQYHHREGFAWSKNSDHSRAIECCKKALELDPTYIISHRIIACSAYELKLWKLAQDHLQQILNQKNKNNYYDDKQLKEFKQLIINYQQRQLDPLYIFYDTNTARKYQSKQSGIQELMIFIKWIFTQMGCRNRTKDIKHFLNQYSSKIPLDTGIPLVCDIYQHLNKLEITYKDYFDITAIYEFRIRGIYEDAQQTQKSPNILKMLNDHKGDEIIWLHDVYVSICNKHNINPND